MREASQRNSSLDLRLLAGHQRLNLSSALVQRTALNWRIRYDRIGVLSRVEDAVAKLLPLGRKCRDMGSIFDRLTIRGARKFRCSHQQALEEFPYGSQIAQYNQIIIN
jgi:hypothetical protein